MPLPISSLQEPVLIGSLQHIIPVCIGIVISIWFIRHSKLNFNQRQKQKAIHAIGCAVSFTVISYHVYRIVLGDYNFKTDLPLFLCSLMALIIPIFTYFRKYWMFEILVFWIIGGTLQAVLTPDIPVGFASFDYFRFWIVHLGLLSIIFYFIFVFEMKPRFTSIFKSIVALQVYIALMMLINELFDANYSYLSEKPKSESLLDYFGEWPLYILIVQAIMIPVFLLIYLPFYRSDKKDKNYLANN